MGEAATRVGPVLSFAEVGTERKYFGFDVSLSFDLYCGQVLAIDVPERLALSLVRMTRREVSPARGEIFLLGRNLTTFGRTEFTRILADTLATVPTFPRIDDSMTVREWLTHRLLLRGMRVARAGDEVDDLLDWAGKRSFASCFPADLSPTEIRWVSMLNVMVSRPRLLLVEPEAFGTDPAAASGMIRALGDWCHSSGASALWPTSWLRGACMADRMLVYASGRCVDADEA